jgi:hypothetical protein
LTESGTPVDRKADIIYVYLFICMGQSDDDRFYYKRREVHSRTNYIVIQRR